MWRARVPPPARMTICTPSRRASTISSRIGKSAARPRSITLCPPILTTRTSGMTATGRYSTDDGVAPVSVDADKADAMLRRSATGHLAGDHGADILAGERARELPGLEPVHDHDPRDVLGLRPGPVQLVVEDVLGRHAREQLAERDLRDVLRVGVLLRVLVVQAVLVLDVDDLLHAEHLGELEQAEVGAVHRQRALERRRLPEVVRRHRDRDRRAAGVDVERAG